LILNAALLGLSRRKTTERVERIVEYSGLGDFINEPLRTCSSGMVVRFGFSAAIQADPDILLIDESLAVGDAAFQEKCRNTLEELLRGASRCCSSLTPQARYGRCASAPSGLIIALS